MPAEDMLDLLFETIPSWLSFPVKREGAISGYAAPDGTIWKSGPIHLKVQPKGKTAGVRESIADRLPDWCPELHLYMDGSFCLGLNALSIIDEATAQQWWADLEVHLHLLSVALKTRVWPQHSGLDHDDAGAYQFAARRLAEKLGLQEEYARAQIGDESWISDLELTLVAPDGSRRDIHVPCPCGCTTNSAKPYSFKRCPRRRKITALILLERARRLALANFWASVQRQGARCCGRMRDCPLATGAISAPPAGLLAQTRRAVAKLHL